MEEKKKTKKKVEPEVPEADLQTELSHAKKTIEMLSAERDTLIEAAKRAMADLANFKKRIDEERHLVGMFANASLIASLLPILDNVARAIKNIPDSLRDDQWVQGIVHIERQLKDTLVKQGLEEIPSAVGQPFDPEKHEAVLEGPGEKDAVLEEFERGYLFQGKILRATKVKVGNGEDQSVQTVS